MCGKTFQGPWAPAMPASAAGPPPAPLTGACPAELTATGWTDSDRPTEARNRPTVCYTHTLRKRRRKERGGRKGERGLVVPATSQACVKIGAKLRAALGQGCASLLCVSGASTKHRPCRACSPWGRKESDTTEQLHFHFHALEKEMATHSNVLAWRIPETGEPGGLLSMGSHRVGTASSEPLLPS